MKFYLMPKEPTWWVWLVNATLLALGLAGFAAAFLAAIALATGQCVFFIWRDRSLRSYAVQIRIAYVTLLMVSFAPPMRWLYWLPAVGTYALVFFGYCLAARTLSLMPWNRSQPLTAPLLRRTFFTAPVVGRPDHGLPAAGCFGGVCEQESRVATLPNSSG